MTKKEYFVELKKMVEVSTVENKENIIAFIDHEVELLNRKSSRSGQTKTQKENIAIKEKILNILAENGDVFTISELLAYDELKEYSNQKISALTNQLVNEGKANKTRVKKVSYFKIS